MQSLVRVSAFSDSDSEYLNGTSIDLLYLFSQIYHSKKIHPRNGPRLPVDSVYPIFPSEPSMASRYRSADCEMARGNGLNDPLAGQFFKLKIAAHRRSPGGSPSLFHVSAGRFPKISTQVHTLSLTQLLTPPARSVALPDPGF